MNRICWWLGDLLSLTLEETQREAVRGDMAESRESGVQALRELVGLVARRQAEIWSDWRPWLTLAWVLFPIGALLSIVSGAIEGASSTYGWLYFHNWDWRLLEYRGFWYILGQSLRSLFGGYVRIACLSWSAGFLLGRKIRCFKSGALGVLFCLMLLLGVLKGAPAYWAFELHEIQRWLRLPRVPAQQHPVAASAVYQTILPLIIVVIIVALPALFGMQHGRARTMRPGIATFAIPAAIAALAGTVLQVPGIIVLVLLKMGIPPGTWRGGPPLVHFAIAGLMLVTYWPLAYLLVKIVQGLRERFVEVGFGERLQTNVGEVL